MSDIIKKMPVAYEPKRKNRWVVTFPEEFGIESWCVQSTDRPTLEIINDEIEINEINFIFVDPIGPSVTERLYNLLTNGYNKKEFEYILEMVDPTGISVEKWTISGCKILKINFGHLDYSNSEIMTCEMVIKPKTANLHI